MYHNRQIGQLLPGVVILSLSRKLRITHCTFFENSPATSPLMGADLLAAMPEVYGDDVASPIPAVRATV
jgi:hypothetical protein